MTLFFRVDDSPIYHCDMCGTERNYLSTSWSEITLYRANEVEPQILHHCLDCRSNKKEWREPAQ